MKLILKGIDGNDYCAFRDGDFKEAREHFAAEMGKAPAREIPVFASVPDLSSDTTATGSLSARSTTTNSSGPQVHFLLQLFSQLM